jgi:hypothetical protein
MPRCRVYMESEDNLYKAFYYGLWSIEKRVTGRNAFPIEDKSQDLDL